MFRVDGHGLALDVGDELVERIVARAVLPLGRVKVILDADVVRQVGPWRRAQGVVNPDLTVRVGELAQVERRDDVLAGAGHGAAYGAGPAADQGNFHYGPNVCRELQLGQTWGEGKARVYQPSPKQTRGRPEPGSVPPHWAGDPMLFFGTISMVGGLAKFRCRFLVPRSPQRMRFRRQVEHLAAISAPQLDRLQLAARQPVRELAFILQAVKAGGGMPSLTEAEIAKLRIDKFIFHVVHHGAVDPILLDQVPIGAFEQFFLDRVIETLRGNRFVFSRGSLTRESLAAVRTSPRRFVEESKRLARAFHSGDQRIKRGVLIVIALSAGSRPLYSLIKYDHERVLSYDLQETKAILRAVVNNFTESKDALQKSALIELKGHGGDLVVIDRTKRTGITTFFQDFLGVERQHTEADMTTELTKALVTTVKKHVNDLPLAITSRVKPRLVEIATRRGAFEADQFFGDFFGADGTDAIKATFESELASRAISGESFDYDKLSLPVAGPTTFVTSEGVRLVIPERAQSTVRVEPTADGAAVITIRTQKLLEQ